MAINTSRGTLADRIWPRRALQLNKQVVEAEVAKSSRRVYLG